MNSITANMFQKMLKIFRSSETDSNSLAQFENETQTYENRSDYAVAIAELDRKIQQLQTSMNMELANVYEMLEGKLERLTKRMQVRAKRLSQEDDLKDVAPPKRRGGILRGYRRN